MHLKKLLLGVAALGLIAGAMGVNAQVNAPQVSTINPTADLIQIVPRGQPSAQSRYATPALLAVTGGYYKSVPATGFTYTFGNNIRVAAFDPGATISTGTVTMSPNPSDGAEQCIFSTATITTLTVGANTGQTIADAATTITANGRICYLYSLSNATWNRSQ